MIEPTDVRPSPDADAFADASRAPRPRSRCAQCNGPFGMIRRHRAGRQFCCVACMERYDDALRETVRAKAHWYDLIDRLRARNA